MQKLISVLVPVKNGGVFLEECLHSILAQTISNWELIIVDDHSTDNTLEILNSFSKKDQRIKAFKNTGTGIIPALQLAYTKSKGDFITRMDADDVMTPNKLKVLSQSLIFYGDGYLSTGLVQYFSENKLGNGFKSYQNWLNELTALGCNFKEIYKECVIPSPCWMVSRLDFDKCGGFESNIYPEDYDLCFRFYKNQLKVIPCDTILHKWRDYQTRTSRVHKHYTDNSFFDLKCLYFIELDYQSQKELVLWGTGKKGKKIAKILIAKQIPFTWVSDNNKKIGHDIYGVIIKCQPVEFFVYQQYIIAVSNKEEQKIIKKMIPLNNDFFFFT